MVAVAGDHLGPLREEVSYGQFVVHVQSPAGFLAPGEIAQAVGPIIVTLLEDLLVQAGAIEAHGLRQGDVLLEGFVGGGGPDTVGIEALVEHEALEVGLVVQIEVTACQMHLAHAGV